MICMVYHDGTELGFQSNVSKIASNVTSNIINNILNGYVIILKIVFSGLNFLRVAIITPQM